MVIAELSRVSGAPLVIKSTHPRKFGNHVTVQKSVLHAQVAFLLIRPIVVFHRPPVLPSPLSIIRFHILFEQTFNIESFAFSPGKIYILAL